MTNVLHSLLQVFSSQIKLSSIYPLGAFIYLFSLSKSYRILIFYKAKDLPKISGFQCYNAVSRKKELRIFFCIVNQFQEVI